MRAKARLSIPVAYRQATDPSSRVALHARDYWAARLGFPVDFGTRCWCDGQPAVIRGFTTGFVLVEVGGLVRPVQPAGRITFEEVAA